MAFTEFYVNAAAVGNNTNAGDSPLPVILRTSGGNWVAATGVYTLVGMDTTGVGIVVGMMASVHADGASLTGFVGRITAFDLTTVTVSLTAKAGTAPVDGTANRTLAIGGPWKGPNGAVGFPFGFMVQALNDGVNLIPRVNFKNNAQYTTSSAVSHAITDNGPVIWQGYATTPGDGGRAGWGTSIGAGSYILLTMGGANTRRQWLEDFEFYANGTTGTATGVSFQGVDGGARNVTVQQSRGIGLLCNGPGSTYIQCEAYVCNQSNTAGLAGITHGNNIRLIRCSSIASNKDGFSTGTGASQNSILMNCMSWANAGSGYSFKAPTATAGSSLVLRHCDSYGNDGDGFTFDAITAGGVVFLENCNFIFNDGWGIRQLDALYHTLVMQNCGFGAGTMANALGNMSFSATANMLLEDGTINYTADAVPWKANSQFIGHGEGIGVAHENFCKYSMVLTAEQFYADLTCAQGPGAGALLARRFRR
jgi:hypothetical protein